MRFRFRFRFRQTLQDSPLAGVVLAVAILALAVGAWYWLQEPEQLDRDRSELWYYDLNTSKRFPIKYHATIEVPPQPAPSGPLLKESPPLPVGAPAGVRLYRFACGSCSGVQFDGYLKTFTLEAQKLWIEERVSFDTIQDEVLIRRLEGGEWVTEGTPEARKIMLEPVERCRAQNLRPRECEVHDK